MENRFRNSILFLSAVTLVSALVLIVVLVRSQKELPPEVWALRSASESRPGSARGESRSARAFESAEDDPIRGVTTAQPSDPLLDELKSHAADPNAVANEMLITFRDKAAQEAFKKKMGGFGLKLIGSLDALNALRIGYQDLGRLRDLLGEFEGGASAEANFWMRLPQEPRTDSSNEGGTTPFQRGQSMMDAIAAGGDRSQWGAEIKVAVLDTGIMNHPTFGQTQVTHVDLVNDGQTFHSHGTSVASLIAGQNPQAPGVAPATSILDVRVADPEGFTVSSVLSQGIIEAVDRGAKVLNISFGGTGDSDVLRAALDYAWKKGAVVVAAAGNEGVDQLSYPAAYEGVLSVGSVDAKGKQASFSNSGQGLDIVAPGVGVVTAWETDKVAITSGTSHSTGLVSGSAAAYLAWGVPSQDVIRLLKSHAKRTGAPTQQVGAGILSIRQNAR
jgi:subtilisin family serine protease